MIYHDIYDRLELLRRINCLGQIDIERAFGFDEHILHKYEKCRAENGSYGNFQFIFDLDTENADKFFSYLGYDGIDLNDKRI